MIKMLIKSIISLLISTIMVPLNAALIPLALLSICVKKIIRRFKVIEGDLRTLPSVTKHVIKLKLKRKK